MVGRSTADLASRQHVRDSEPATAMLPGEAAAYISDMAADLRNIASRAGLPLLTQLLEMVLTEALSLSNDRSQWVKKPVPRSELQQRR